MAVNDSRSMNADLQMGLLDGKKKSLTPDRGGEVEQQHAVKRLTEVQEQYGIVYC